MKLYGMPLSNYFNMVKHALREKGLEFEEIHLRPSQQPDFLKMSPMGKVPVLETSRGYITETDAILDYLEETNPEIPLFPEDPFARAKVRQLMKIQELYVETPVHELVLAIFGKEVPQDVRDKAHPAAEKGLAALARVVHFNPWLCGNQLTFADIFVYYSFSLSNRLTKMVYGWDMLRDIPGLAAWNQCFTERGVTQSILADNKTAAEALAARK